MGAQMPWHACKNQRTTCGMWVSHCTPAVLEYRGAGEPGLERLRVLHVNHQRDLKWTDCLLKWKGRDKEGKRSNEEVLQWDQDLSKPISQISRLLVTLFLRSQFSWEKRSLLDFYHGMTLVTMEFGRPSLEGDSPTLTVLPEIGCPSFGLGIHSGSQFSPSTM